MPSAWRIRAILDITGWLGNLRLPSATRPGAQLDRQTAFLLLVPPAVHRSHGVNASRPRTPELDRAPDNKPVRSAIDVNQRFSGLQDRVRFFAGYHRESSLRGVLGCVLQSLAAELIHVAWFIRLGSVPKGPSKKRPGSFHELSLRTKVEGFN